MLKTWIYAGQLRDPFQEFFVFETPTPQRKKGGGEGSAWETRYALRGELVPGFLGEGVVRKVFLIGKSLNFIREDCGEEAYVVPQSEGNDAEMKGKPPPQLPYPSLLRGCCVWGLRWGLMVELEYGNTVALEQRIDKAYLTTTSKLVDLMKSKFGLWDHLNAFKKYILLGQGDFIALLMESIGYLPPPLQTPKPLIHKNLSS